MHWDIDIFLGQVIYFRILIKESFTWCQPSCLLCHYVLDDVPEQEVMARIFPRAIQGACSRWAPPSPPKINVGLFCHLLWIRSFFSLCLVFLFHLAKKKDKSVNVFNIWFVVTNLICQLMGSWPSPSVSLTLTRYSDAGCYHNEAGASSIIQLGMWQTTPVQSRSPFTPTLTPIVIVGPDSLGAGRMNVRSQDSWCRIWWEPVLERIIRIFE